MKTIGAIVALAILVSGCATANTVEKRRAEQATAYANLTQEQRALVDMGQIAIGMPMDAVYIAWGRPSQVAVGQTERGQTVTWIYTGTGWQEHRYWNYRYRPVGRYGYAPEPYLEYDYVPYSYQAAEVIFENGVVKNWRTLTAPPPY